MVADPERADEISTRAARPHPARAHGAPVRQRRYLDANDARHHRLASGTALTRNAACVPRALRGDVRGTSRAARVAARRLVRSGNGVLRRDTIEGLGVHTPIDALGPP